MVMQSTLFGYGFTSVSSQAEVVPDSQPRRGPPKATGDSRPSCGARGGQSTTTGQQQDQERPIKIMHWNACGLKYKKEELREYLRKYEVDICAIQETHLKPQDRFWIRGYEGFRQDRISREKGGIITLVSNTLTAVETSRSRKEGDDHDQDTEYLGIDVLLPSRTLQIFNIYSPPDKNFLFETPTRESNCLAIGDFNSHSPSWGYSTMDSKGEDVEQWAVDNQLVLINKPEDPPTFTSRSWRTTHTPDLAFATDDLHKVCERNVGQQLGGSDHRPVLLTAHVNYTPLGDIREPSWNMKKADWSSFQERSELLAQRIKLTGNMNRDAKEFNTAILQAAKESIPRGYRRNYKPYWNARLEELHCKLNQARDEMDEEPSDENTIEHNKALATFRREKLKQCREKWHQTTESLNMEKDGRKLWNLTKSLNEDRPQKTNTAITANGSTSHGKKAADILADTYHRRSLLNMPQVRKLEVRSEIKNLQKPTSPHSIMGESISLGELKRNIKTLKNRKAPGPDGILNEMIKHLGPKAQATLLTLFNQSWTQGQVPEVWKEAHIIPIHKKGKAKTDPNSYRPISLISCVGKLLERIINQRLMYYLENNNILTPTQSGFRKNKNTEDQLTYFVQNIENAFQEQKSLLSVFFDLSQAFDTVWKEGLKVKLLQSGIQGKMYKWLSSFLHDRTARVKLDGRHYSKKLQLREGVPQGSAISPTLFVIYINDITTAITPQVDHTLHADDFAIWSAAEHVTTAKVRVQETVNRVLQWTKDWGLNINQTKTTVMKFSLKTKEKDVTVQLNGQDLPTDDTPTFLGVTFDKRLTWKPHINKINQKAIKRMQIMKKLSGTQWGANSKVLRQVYQGYVRPVMEYASPAWSTAAPSNVSCLDKTQNQGLRIVLGAMKSTPLAELHRQTETDTLENRRQQKTLIGYEKSKRNPTHPLHNTLQERTKNRLKKRKSPNHIMKDLHRQNCNYLPKEEDMCENLQGPDLAIPQAAEHNTVYTIPGINKKEEELSHQMKLLSLEYIHETYPETTWTHIYTDGSAEGSRKNGGAGVSIRKTGEAEKRKALPSGTVCSNFRAELTGIKAALEYISEETHTGRRYVIFCDSLSAIQSLDREPKDSLTRSILTILSNINAAVTVQWIPSHIGIPGNETADQLAKEGSKKPQEPVPLTLQEAKALIKGTYTDKWKQEHNNYSVKGDPMHILPRKEQRSIFRLRTGHCRVGAHMSKITAGRSAACPCGATKQTVEHLLQNCPLLKEARQRLWPQSTPLNEKLWGDRHHLSLTTEFLDQTNVQP